MSNPTQGVHDRIDQYRDEAIGLTKDFTNIRTPTGEEAELATYIVDWLEDNDFDATLQEIGSEQYNAVGRLGGSGDGNGRSLTLNGHMDTAHTGSDEERLLAYGPGTREPEAEHEDGKLWGAGLVNDKAPIAAFLVGAKAIKDADVTLDGDLLLTAVSAEIGHAAVDEFRGKRYRGHGYGTRQLLADGHVSDVAVVAENSNWGVGWGLPGVLYLKVTLHGDPAYTPYIEYDRLDEDHAVFRLLGLADHIREWATEYSEENTVEYGNGTIKPVVNVGAIRSGRPHKPNFQPAIGHLYLDVRVPPTKTPETVRKEARAAIKEFGDDVAVRAYRAQRGYAPDSETHEELVDHVTRAHRDVRGSDPNPMTVEENSKWNDVNVFHEHGIPAVKIGPSTVDEGTLTEEDLVDAAKLYASCALSICGTAD